MVFEEATGEITMMQVTILLLFAGSSAKKLSQFWGENGELWKPGDPLMDFSYAGYQNGEKDIPDYPVGVKVTDFGAVGDGITDDKPAIVSALQQCPEGHAVFFPPGQYLIGSKFYLPKKSISLRGNSPEDTALVFNKGLLELDPNVKDPKIYSYARAFVNFHGSKESGIENFTFRFPERAYDGHLKERGCNGIQIGHSDNCWIRNIHFINPDNGFFFQTSENSTAENLEFSMQPGRTPDHRGRFGHHGFTIKQYSKHVLVQNFTFHNSFVHEATLGTKSTKNVIAKGKGPFFRFDHHWPKENWSVDNLFTDIEVEDPEECWRNNAKGSADGTVYWNVRSILAKLPYPQNEYSNNLFIGFNGTGQPIEGNGNIVELEGNRIKPKNLYRAQLALRLSKK